MIRAVLIFTAGIVLGALGGTYLAGVEEGRREAKAASGLDAEDTGKASEDYNAGTAETA